MLTRLLIHLSNQELVCVPWRFGRPQSEHRFAATAGGLQAFSAFLAPWRHVPACLAVDLIEEDFRIDTLPHLRRPDRQTVIQRRLGQMYRGTPFRMAVLQGREAGGRRDDIMLCTAITQSEGLAAWLDVMEEQGVPVLGVYPTALLGEALLRALGAPATHVLLVTPLSEEAVRISFFQQGRLKFSRISEHVGPAGHDEVARMREETRKTLQYVTAQPWFERAQVTATLVIAAPEVRDRIQRQWAPEDSSLQVVTPGALAVRLRMPALAEGASATAIFLQLLMHRRPPNQLAPRERTRAGRLWRARTALFALSGLIATAACLLALVDLRHGLQVQEGQQVLLTQLAHDRNETGQLQGSLPGSTTPPDLMSATVRFYQNEVQGRPRLQDALQTLSVALDAQPEITLHRVSWAVSTSPPVATVNSPRDAPLPASAAQDAALLTGAMPRTFFVDLRLEADIPAAAADHAAALQSAGRFTSALASPGRQVQLLTPPFDVNPLHSLSGDSLMPARRAASFNLRLVERHTP